MDSASLPFYHLTISASHPQKPGYPTALVTIGDHIRKRRLDLGLFQRQVAAQIGVDEAEIRYLPNIISFLGYNPWPKPEGFPDRLVLTRSIRGMSRVFFARLLGIDPSTLARWESGRRKPSGRHLDSLKLLLQAPS